MKKEGIICAVSLTIAALLLAIIIFMSANMEKWQSGYYPEEWLVNGVKQLEIDYDDINYQLVNVAYGKDRQNYHYKVELVTTTNRDSVGDIGIWYVEYKKCDVYISLKHDKKFWNKLCSAWLIDEKEKFSRCLDYDITLEAQNDNTNNDSVNR